VVCCSKPPSLFGKLSVAGAASEDCWLMLMNPGAAIILRFDVNA
jgi:hypothetical protein